MSENHPESILTDDEEDIQSKKDQEMNHEMKGRRKIDIKYISDKSKRNVTFAKRKAGLIKKVFSLILFGSLISIHTIGYRIKYIDRIRNSFDCEF